ncbi:monovalent cation/H+ antiporter complex subunit F [Arthrobacter sp. NPDC089319]|uniref:monovalent cation/H+ antiporter complex subunit F n=1 Tax=Arthrobacter sp. NPDC089319 TaxID=3155915 RepID=UPI003433E2B4
MSVAQIIVSAILALAAVLALVRLARGPSLLDRLLAIDVLLAVVCAGLIVDMAAGGHTNNLTLVVVICLVGFIGSVAVARFVTDGRAREH